MRVGVGSSGCCICIPFAEPGRLAERWRVCPAQVMTDTLANKQLVSQTAMIKAGSDIGEDSQLESYRFCE
jgi:hypothetical protein